MHLAVFAIVWGIVSGAIAGRAQPGVAPTLEMRARAMRPGEVLRVDWTALDDYADSGAVIAAFGHVFPIYTPAPGRRQSLVGIDLDLKPGTYDVALISASRQTLAIQQITLEDARFTTRTLKVDPGFVNPPRAVMPRIEREAKLMADVFASPSPERLWSGAGVRPVPHPANSRFGSRSVFNGEPRNAHTGTDFLSPAGTPIRAPLAGRVVVAQDLYFSGGAVFIDHGLGLFSQLVHMSKIGATVGQLVEAGDIVGLVGATGRVTGPHLHWGMRLGGQRVDPLALLEVLKD
jgi:hypothetical protein